MESSWLFISWKGIVQSNSLHCKSKTFHLPRKRCKQSSSRRRVAPISRRWGCTASDPKRGRAPQVMVKILGKQWQISHWRKISSNNSMRFVATRFWEESLNSNTWYQTWEAPEIDRKRPETGDSYELCRGWLLCLDETQRVRGLVLGFWPWHAPAILHSPAWMLTWASCPWPLMLNDFGPVHVNNNSSVHHFLSRRHIFGDPMPPESDRSNALPVSVLGRSLWFWLIVLLSLMIIMHREM